MTELHEPAITVVTVTYGDRWHLLREVCAAIEADPLVVRVVIVDNGSSPPVSTALKRSGLRKPDLVQQRANLGSASGYAVGIARACALGASWMLLLDDDTVPAAQAIATLLDAALLMSTDSIPSVFALAAFRASRHASLLSGEKPLYRPNRGSFLGFHVLDVPDKALRRLRRNKREHCHNLDAATGYPCLPFSSYSGLFFHRTLIDRIGLPDTRFILYGDDNEFSSRITNAGGCIALLPNAEILDLEQSWAEQSACRNTFAKLLAGPSETRVFYAVRNQVYCDTLERGAAWRPLNRIVFMTALRGYALMKGKRRRYATIARAVSLGSRGTLGLCAEFPLA